MELNTPPRRDDNITNPSLEPPLIASAPLTGADHKNSVGRGFRKMLNNFWEPSGISKKNVAGAFNNCSAAGGELAAR